MSTMAYLDDNRRPALGDLVYPGYAPRQAGKVIAITPKPPAVHLAEAARKILQGYAEKYPTLTVQMPNGKTYELDAMRAQDFRALIADHRRKLATHEAMLAKLEAM